MNKKAFFLGNLIASNKDDTLAIKANVLYRNEEGVNYGSSFFFLEVTLTQGSLIVKEKILLAMSGWWEDVHPTLFQALRDDPISEQELEILMSFVLKKYKQNKKIRKKEVIKKIKEMKKIN